MFSQLVVQLDRARKIRAADRPRAPDHLLDWDVEHLSTRATLRNAIRILKPIERDNGDEENGEPCPPQAPDELGAFGSAGGAVAMDGGVIFARADHAPPEDDQESAMPASSAHRRTILHPCPGAPIDAPQ